MKYCRLCGAELPENAPSKRYCNGCARYLHILRGVEMRRKKRSGKLSLSDNLVRDANAAMASGISYGQYMALKNQKKGV
ncbi:MAG: hypothetical protein J6K77_07470 [Ruminococcus sp.]|nr:hypothetical protein [Ruminococcus sp.]